MKLTKEQIETTRSKIISEHTAHGECGYIASINALCDMALSSIETERAGGALPIHAAAKLLASKLAITPDHDSYDGDLKIIEDALRSTMSAPPRSEAVDAHADHPLRHYDRTCPACQAEARSGGELVADLNYLAASDGLRYGVSITETCRKAARALANAHEALDVAGVAKGAFGYSLRYRIGLLLEYAEQAESALKERNEDAERYRWIRNYTVVYRYGTDEHGLRLPHVETTQGNLMRGSIAEHLDNAIDAAMKENGNG